MILFKNSNFWHQPNTFDPLKLEFIGNVDSVYSSILLRNFYFLLWKNPHQTIEVFFVKFNLDVYFWGYWPACQLFCLKCVGIDKKKVFLYDVTMLKKNRQALLFGFGSFFTHKYLYLTGEEVYLFSSKRNWIIFIFKMSIEMDIFYTNVGNKACHVLGKKFYCVNRINIENFFLCLVNLCL